METSAINDVNVEEAFMRISKDVYARLESGPVDKPKALVYGEKKMWKHYSSYRLNSKLTHKRDIKIFGKYSDLYVGTPLCIVKITSYFYKIEDIKVACSFTQRFRLFSLKFCIIFSYNNIF